MYRPTAKGSNMRHGSLFSGIGGFDLAAEWMGWENVFHCEINPFCQKILNHYWPNAISYEDIKQTDFTSHAGNIDVLTGGFPCQPYSTAGKRLGKEDERHLWPEMLRAIREISPRWVVGENVRGLTNWNGGVVFEEVQADLETEGYEVLPFLLPACAVDAPHRRDRIWIIAHRHRAPAEHQVQTGSGGEYGAAADTTGERLEGTIGRASTGKGFARHGEQINANSNNERLQRSTEYGSVDGSGEEYNEQPTGFFRTAWQDFPTVAPLCNGNDGILSLLDTAAISFPKWRNETIKAGGNAVVPQIPYRIFKAISTYEQLQTTQSQ